MARLFTGPRGAPLRHQPLLANNVPSSSGSWTRQMTTPEMTYSPVPGSWPWAESWSCQLAFLARKRMSVGECPARRGRGPRHPSVLTSPSPTVPPDHYRRGWSIARKRRTGARVRPKTSPNVPMNSVTYLRMCDPLLREQLWPIPARVGEIRMPAPAAWRAVAEVAGSRCIPVTGRRSGQN